MRLPIHVCFLIVAIVAPKFSHAEISRNAEAGLFAKRVIQSKNWDQLIKNTLQALPKNRIEEFSKFSQGQIFPDIILKKNHFEISDENGSRVEIKLYKNGISSLNQINFKIRPLATIEEEIHRISDSVESDHSRTSSWDFLESSAVAGILSPGVALATHVVSTGWAADQCGKSDLSDEQRSSCPLMAVSMRSSGPNPVDMLAVGLTCPRSTSSGTLEMIDQSPHGSRRTRVVYSDGNPVSIEMAAASAGGSYIVLESFKIGSEKNETENELSQTISIQANSLKTGVCEGSPSDKKRYYASLSSNSASLRKSQANDQDDSDRSGTGKAI